VPQILERAYIEISNICNLQCTFCPIVERDKKILAVDSFHRFAVQVKPLAKQVCLHLMGEPLAHPQFAEISKVCSELGLRIFLTTNGTLISRQAELLCHWKSLDQINFSLHSYYANPQKIELQKYLQPIFQFCDDIQQLNPDVYINLRLWNLDSPTQQAEQNIALLSEIEKHFGVEVKPEVDTRNYKSKKLKGRLYVHFDTEFKWPDPKDPNLGEQGFCHALSKQIAIHADGTVVPCCLDKEARIRLGNLNENSLDEIINSARAQAMLAGFKRRKLVEDLCQRCTYIDRFGR
jgi:radical SAM protein with 4Fe4S-binding SPASM domain